MEKAKDVFTRGEIKFWIGIVSIVVGSAICFTKLQKDVEAMVEREQVNKVQFMEMAKTVKNTNDTVIEISTRQEFILKNLGINGY